MMASLDTAKNADQRKGAKQGFCWLASGDIPKELDLRRSGWKLVERDRPSEECIGIFHAAGLDNMGWMHILASFGVEMRRHVLVTGVELAHERATLLQIGFGDVVSSDISLEELDARASRVAEALQWLPRHRKIGSLSLDLLAREAFGDDKPLNLNPREFALLWRLADCVGQTVSKQSLIQDVWRMGFVPETNSIAVHMSRLRRKLSFVELSGMIETSSPGGYRLTLPDDHEESRGAHSQYGKVAPAGSGQPRASKH
ncbi:DNA-binding response regulator [Novosphingobium sp. PP1Y]|uniref:response regulator transcription factor n=1 Tax=Novosphingobium sp. PP1Y TaxID=702113 RepID=UPI0002FC5ED1|nr:winged helix-turn-helix domain-containing protein [Novosphingobium sp. PP1Y]